MDERKFPYSPSSANFQKTSGEGLAKVSSENRVFRSIPLISVARFSVSEGTQLPVSFTEDDSAYFAEVTKARNSQRRLRWLEEFHSSGSHWDRSATPLFLLHGADPELASGAYGL
jgi:hypothetical protein